MSRDLHRRLREAEDRQRIYSVIVQHRTSALNRPWISGREAEIGDLIVSSTRGPPRQVWDPWLVGFLVDRLGYDSYMVRDVASDRLCRVGNDLFSVVRDIDSILLLAGHQYRAYRRCRRALRHGWRTDLFDSYGARFADCQFADRDTRDGVLYVRPHSFMGPHCPPRGPIPEGKGRPGQKGVSSEDQWHVITEWKAVPFRATSRLRNVDLAERVAEALQTPYRHFAVPFSYRPGGGFGSPSSLRDPLACPDAIEVTR